MTYAALADLAEYLDVEVEDLEADSERLLGLASVFIDQQTLGRIDTDNDDQLEAAKLAVCAQVEFWRETGDDTGASGAFSSLSIGAFSISRGGGSSGAPNLELAPRAYQALFMEGLLYRGVDIK